MLDKATSIRKGEELNIPNLEKYLLQHIPNASGNLIIEQFPGGASNLTYLLKLGEQQLVLRRPPFGANVKSGHDMGREYKVLNALSKSYGKAPKPFVYTEDKSIIGDSFYVMDRVQGVILRSNRGFAKTLTETQVTNIADSLCDTMVELHGLDYNAVGLGDLGKPQGYAERQVKGWTKRYFKAKTDEHPELEKVAQWLNDKIPAVSDASIVHNDYKHDNVILDPNDLTKIIAILDWEMCTLGDPLMDLGTTLGYWLNPNDPPFMKMALTNPTALKGNPTRGEFAQLYAEKSGRDLGDLVFYYVFGLFKIAVIVQQIYYRYKHGYTQDKRFAQFNFMVQSLGKLAERAVKKDRVDDLF